MDHSEGFLKIANEAKAKIKQTNVDAIKKRMDAGEKINLIDCREESEWANGHIKGAEYLGKGVVERDIEVKHPNKNQELVFYCGGGFRSALVCETLQRMGYKNLLSMDGGWRGWTEKKYPTEK
jgi:rhodanese-related sulfurtransferase